MYLIVIFIEPMIPGLILMHRSSRAEVQSRGSVSLCDVSFCSPSPLGFAHVQTPTFARGSVFANEPSAQQVQEQDKYKVYLKEQVKDQAVPGGGLSA